MWSRLSSSGAAVLLRVVRAGAWRLLDAPPWFARRVIVRVSGPGFAPAAGYARHTGGVLAVRLQPEQPLASSRPEPRRHGPVRRQLQVIAGTTPIPAEPRVFGTSARSQA